MMEQIKKVNIYEKFQKEGRVYICHSEKGKAIGTLMSTRLLKVSY